MVNIWGGSMNRGTPKSSIYIGFSIVNHPFWSFWGTPMTMETSWNLHIPSSKWHDFVWREDSDSKHQLKHTMPSKHTMRYTPWSVASRGLSKLISLQFADGMVTKSLSCCFVQLVSTCTHPCRRKHQVLNYFSPMALPHMFNRRILQTFGIPLALAPHLQRGRSCRHGDLLNVSRVNLYTYNIDTYML